MLVALVILLLAPSSSSLRQSDASLSLSMGSHILLLGVAGAGFCGYAGRILACCHRPAAGRFGTFLAISLGLSCSLIAFGAIAEAAGTDQEDSGWPFITWALGWLLGIVSIIGTLLFISIVLRGVSAELKIAQGWAAPTDLAP
jgi:hypothetical protein